MFPLLPSVRAAPTGKLLMQNRDSSQPGISRYMVCEYGHNLVMLLPFRCLLFQDNHLLL